MLDVIHYLYGVKLWLILFKIVFRKQIVLRVMTVVKNSNGDFKDFKEFS